MTKDITTPAGAVAVREGFGTDEVLSQGDMGSSSAVAAAKEIEVRAILAERHPRKLEPFRQGLLHYCKHPDFAETAIYRKPVGGGKIAEGFSIRFIEAALTLYHNVYISTRITYEDAERLLISVEVFDLESNLTYGQDAVLPKLVERRESKDRRVVGNRINTEGKQVFIVEATKDEMRNVMGAERSKLIRDQGQKLLPFHILVEARRLIDETNATENAKDPDAAKKKILDRFASLGVTAEMLTAYIDRPLDGLTANDVSELAVLFNGLKDGDIAWADVMRIKQQPAEGEPAPAPEAKRSTLKEKILKNREQRTGGESGGAA
jgi:hypothetical protein